MTISPLMELFPNWYDGPAANWPPGHFYWEDVWGAFPRPMSACGVDHQSKRRDMKIKSTFNISFQIHFVCFVLKKKSHCFLNFIGCCLRFAYSMMQLFCRKVGWWSCVMVTVLLKKTNRQRCLLLKHVPGKPFVKTPLDYFSQTESVVCLWEKPVAPHALLSMREHPLHLRHQLRVVIKPCTRTLYFSRPADITRDTSKNGVATFLPRKTRISERINVSYFSQTARKTLRNAR